MKRSHSTSSSSTLSSSSSSTASDSDDLQFRPPFSKREYLLAQIRQKDQVIDTLLKQLHNPYIATPLSISSFKLAASPSDENKENVLEWFNRLHASVHGPTPPQGPDPKAFSQPGPSETASESGEGEEAEADSDSDGTPSALPDDAVPIGLLARLSLDRQRKRVATGVDEDENVGVANMEYFKPGPATNLSARRHLIEQNAPPDIVVHGLVTPEDVDRLFAIYYEKINPFIHLLDPVLHTPKTIFHRCPFLYTVICAIASRYYPEKSEIYPIAMHFAKHSAATALVDGWKSVELCQAYILMSIYGVPARRWEEDRSWLYTGLAIRLAMDLNLHKLPRTRPQSDRQIREMLNRTRVWLICHNIDRSTATQFGKPITIKEDYIVKNSTDWYKGTEQNHPYDVHLCAYSALMRILTLFIEEVYSDPNTSSGLNKSIDYLSLALRYEEQLDEYHREWKQRFEEMLNPDDPIARFRVTLLPFMTYYSKLVVYSFGFQQAFERGMQASDDIFFKKCFEAAKLVIVHVITVIAPSGYLRYAPDGHFIFASFASAFLLKLLRPEFLHLLTSQMESDIFDVIHQLINVYNSEQVAIDERHTPKLYARFLTGLLSRYRKGGAAIMSNRQQQFPPDGQSVGTSPSSGQSMTGPSLGSGSHSAPQSDDGGSGTYNPDTMQMNGGANVDTQVAGGVQYTTTSCGLSVPGDPMPTGEADIGEDTVMLNTNDLSQLAPMRAITSNLDNFWNNMMLPGYVLPLVMGYLLLVSNAFSASRGQMEDHPLRKAVVTQVIQVSRAISLDSQILLSLS
ncbi:hypothetical protein CONPUDRAFT_67760 [Coniophora puteana RWD-64-598 SS2]|uniref:Xylanolytic transcriptional activator regulatory domain-containing protein n=1 Tax=Coniophora puteana (strain RWD-64-598) TaxID=741705 RepID=R7SGW8_CONPW|nr:uncharacterized protein CONPUDRAFT_67760 [Coniophora puteana RWD-64-598 SS2]EIW74294.1 hypothetical protein CONPUDRAFT_67760 [Coniophora puteana RWD-64-598 SS2]